ncbi:MAG TPA: hypothetical protein VMW25_00750 [Clostridia bacterium]|nr:hypothetical protein [Clostridia bacterium]
MKLAKNQKLFLALLIAGGTAAQSLTMVRSGLTYDFGMGFWGPNGHDGIWHLALINQLAKFSLVHPGLAGVNLTNYHFGFDLLAALIHRLTGLSVITLYFQVLPPVMAILIGTLTFKLVLNWTASRKSAWWATFFVFFGGSWGWLAGLIRDGQWGGESVFWANQAVSTLINPPYALSLIFLLSGLVKLKDFLKKPSGKNLWLTAILFGVLLEIKVYAGMITLGGLAILTLWSFYFHSWRRSMIKLFLITLAISLAVFLPFNWRSGMLLVFSPLWFPRTMLAFGDRLGWFKLENARLTFLNSGQWWKWFLAEGLALGIFILGNLGTRVLGFWSAGQELKNWRKIKPEELFFLAATFIALMLPLIFIQKGNPWNTIQFFYYFQFLLAIWAGKSLGQLRQENLKGSRKVWLGVVLPLMVVALTLPTTVITLKNSYWPSRPPARISLEELEALQFLRRQPEGVVLTPPFDFTWRDKFSEPRPLYAYETTVYVSALADKPTFLADEMNLEISGYSWQKRREESIQFFLTNSHDFANNLIKQNRIAYLYLVKGQEINLGEGDIHSRRIFENGEVKIFKIN